MGIRGRGRSPAVQLRDNHGGEDDECLGSKASMGLFWACAVLSVFVPRLTSHVYDFHQTFGQALRMMMNARLAGM